MGSLFLGKRYHILALLIILIVLAISALASFWTDWAEQPTNPVLDPATGVRAYYPSVTYNENGFNGHGMAAYYKMWFASPDSGVGGIALAYSNNGVDWIEYNNSLPLTGLSVSANHPVVVYNRAGFGGQGVYYKIWYWDSSTSLAVIGALRHAQSVDGVTWQNDQPLQQHPTDSDLQLVDGVSGSYFYHTYGPGCLYYNPSATNLGSTTPDDKSDDQPITYRYIMYYDCSGEGASPNGSIEQEALAYSVDGIYWIRYGDQPVLLPSGNAADWDGMYSYRSTIIRIAGLYHMWYSGANGDNSIGTYYAHGIGHAVSNDGLNWTKDPDNPVFHVTDGVTWRDVRTYTPCVIYDAEGFSGHGRSCNYKMWFTGRTGSNYTIGLAGICDRPPTADFECPPEAIVGEELCFDATASSDPDGDDIVEYEWRLSEQPSGSMSAMSPVNNVQSCFTPDLPGTYIVTLRVASRNDGGERVWSDELSCTLTTRDQQPVAEFECRPDGRIGEEICFDGTESYDPDGDDIVEYEWLLSRRPPGSTSIISPANDIQSCFTPDRNGLYTITLRVASRNLEGEIVWSESVSCELNTQDRVPVASFTCIPSGLVGETVCFDSSGSSDPDGDEIIEYEWRLSGQPSGSTSIMSPANNARSCFTPDVEGLYTITLRVASRNLARETVWSEQVSCQLSTQDRIPIADFQCTPLATVGEKLCFNASASSDPDGDEIVDFVWRLSEKPADSLASMSPVNNVQSCFTPDLWGSYTVCLRVATRNGTNEAVWSEEVSCTITIQDRAPKSLFRCISQGRIGEKLCFDAGSSYDPDGQEISGFVWSLSQKPRGSSSAMLPNQSIYSCFTPDSEGIYRISLKVSTTNSSGVINWSAPYFCDVSVEDRKPVADFTCISSGKVGQEICFDGSASYDPDGTKITNFYWEIYAKPFDSDVIFTSPHSDKNCFIPDTEGIYKISLKVQSVNSRGHAVWSLHNHCVVTVKDYNFCHCPEVVLKVERYEDRMWHGKYRVEKLKWTISTINPVCDIKGFNIYWLENGDWQRIAEVGGHIREYEKNNVDTWHEYRVVPVQLGNRECLGLIQY
jgi:hypothetical protein